jgi:DNA-binding NarL/FixJ family response regulator
VPPYRPCVAIVDDHPGFRRAARELLVARGCAVVAEAACASDALCIADRLSLDGVVVDVRLGEDCGFALARELTRADPGLAVLLVSADHQPSAAARAEACGAGEFAPKERLPDLDLAQLLCRTRP